MLDINQRKQMVLLVNFSLGSLGFFICLINKLNQICYRKWGQSMLCNDNAWQSLTVGLHTRVCVRVCFTCLQGFMSSAENAFSDDLSHLCNTTPRFLIPVHSAFLKKNEPGCTTKWKRPTFFLWPPWEGRVG